MKSFVLSKLRLSADLWYKILLTKLFTDYNVENVERKDNMKKIVLILLNVLLIIPFLVLFRKGANVAIFMLPVWLVMTVVNTIFAKNIRQLILYNVCLSVFATIGIFICGQLYFEYVYWDSMGEAVIQLEMVVEVIYIAILTGVEGLVKYLQNRRRK